MNALKTTCSSKCDLRTRGDGSQSRLVDSESAFTQDPLVMVFMPLRVREAQPDL